MNKEAAELHAKRIRAAAKDLNDAIVDAISQHPDLQVEVNRFISQTVGRGDIPYVSVKVALKLY